MRALVALIASLAMALVLVAPRWSYNDAMKANVSLSIKNVPPVLAKALGERARRHHRSIQGELMHILEEAVRREGPVRVRSRAFDVDRLLRQAEALGLRTEADSVQIVRELRDSR